MNPEIISLEQGLSRNVNTTGVPAIRASQSLEELIYQIIRCDLSASIFRFSEPGDDALAVTVFEGEKVAMMIRVDMSAFRKKDRYLPVGQSLIQLDDESRCVLDMEWFDKRDHRLGIHQDPARGEMVMAPGALTKLILSYLDTPIASIELSREIIQLMTSVPYVVRMRLTCSPNGKDEMWTETINVRLDRLEKLVRKRKAKGVTARLAEIN